ncbi:MAG: hypothetical protein KME16_14550 [Scytolyngbya sp. HA4215-MV1]|nr:hypothetical protein [Scytolyngbya sp. HA4215-MV1]
MPEELETLKAILRKKLPEAEVQALMAEFTLASRQGAVAIQGDATEAVIVPGNQSIVGNNNCYVINQGTDPTELIKILHSLLKEVKSSTSTTPRTGFHQFPEVSKFDLTHMVDKCLGELLGKKGLIGLAVPCGEKAFLKNFCERLKHELGRNNIQIRQTLSLNPQVISVSKAVEAIKQYKKLLQTGDVICPIRVGVGDASSAIPKDFWQQIQTAFQDEFKYRLIVVMVGNADCIFPPDVVCLHPPQFEKVHAFQWIRDITQVLNWMHLSDEWMQKMIERCLCDVQTGCLDVGLVYEHLDYTLSILQSNPSLSAEAFLEQLD